LQEPFPKGAFSLNPETGKSQIAWEQRNALDINLAKLCPGKAIFTYGKEMSVKEVIDEVDQDISFYTVNNGGITVSGGEPLLQTEFVSALLKTAHAHGYTTAIETALNVPWENVKQVIGHVDTVIHDIKIINPEKHEKWTGVKNTLILENVRKAYEEFPNKAFIVRTPVIPGVNDQEEIIKEIVEFINPYPNVIKYELLPYHRLGLGKYGVLGKEYELDKVPSLETKRIEELKAYASFIKNYST